MNEAEVTNMWMQTYTGRQFYPGAPDPMAIHPLDIAQGLSLTCRYGGQVDAFYSVAEHCVLLHDYFTGHELHSTAVQALLHDAAEAYIGDLIRPIKHLFPDFEKMENDVMGAIHAALDVRRPNFIEAPWLRRADLRITLNERDVLMTNATRPWIHEDLGPLPGVIIHGWDPQFAREQYLDRLTVRGLI